MKVKKILFFSIILMVTFILGVKASSLIYGKDVTYDNTSSGLKSTTVQGALDELYESAKNGGAKVSCNDSGECTVTCKQGNPTISDGSYSCTSTTNVTCPKGKYFLMTDTGYKCSEVNAGKAILNDTAIVTNGDGLYKDTVTDGRYYYRGANPNNYITFNNETWRIISIESDGTLKIVRNGQLSSTQVWDRISNRNGSTSTYCGFASSYGCNAWAATSNLVGNPSTIIQYYPNGNASNSEKYEGTVTNDSTMAIHLNGTYYNSLTSKAKTKVVKGTFNVSTPGRLSDTESLETDAKEENQYQWKGYIALYTVTELLRASTNSNCTTLNKGANGNCKSGNWLWPSDYEWTLSPIVDTYRGYAGLAYSSGAVVQSYVYNAYAIRPVLHLSSNISLSGTGSSSDPYTIN